MSENSRLIEDAERFVAEGQWQAAARAYEQLSAIHSSEPEVYYLHGRVLMEMNQWQAALGKFEHALSISATEPRYHLGRGDTLQAMGALQKASDAYRHALTLAPDHGVAMVNLGNVMHQQGDLLAALDWFGRALRLDPSNLKAINNLGKTFQDMGDLRRARIWYDKALAIDPHYAEARFNRAAAMLAVGDYINGWREYEWRFQRKSARRVYPHRLRGPRWDATPFHGKRLLVHCEQGFGDVIQFCRYLPAVKKRGGTLILEVHKPLVPLLQGMTAVDWVIAFDNRRPTTHEYDIHIPLMSLPLLLGTTLESIPSQIPYLNPSPAMRSQWQRRSAEHLDRSVGIVWSGSATDPRRSCPIESVIQLCSSVAGIRFFSLQKELPEGITEDKLSEAGITHWGERLSDFDATAAAISQLDLVISIDTATAHLAGAMGKPLWLLLPHASDWRWLQDRDDSPWYPTARLFRQPTKDDWAGMLPAVIEALHHKFPTSAEDCPAPIEATTDHQATGNRLAKHGDLEEAIKSYQLALIERPECAQTQFQMGCALHRLNRFDSAISAYQKAVDRDPTEEAAHRNMGLACYQTGRLHEAIDHYQQALKLNPDTVDLLITLGSLYARSKIPKKAEAFYRHALEVEPNSLSARYNLGNLWLDQGRLASAAQAYQLVLERDPRHLKSLCNMGRALHRLGRLQEALTAYDRGLAIDPLHAELRFNRAITLLLAGEWKAAWPDYEWRFKCHNRHRIYPHQLRGQRWQGEPFQGKTLLIHAEQGLGDAIQYVRYMPEVKARGGEVVLETHPSLVRLFERVEAIDRLEVLSPQQPPQVRYDLFVPMCSLSGILNETPWDAPTTSPYLSVEASEVEAWRSRLPSHGINIGIVWAGSDTYPERTCSLDDFSALADLPDINWIGLQKGPSASQANAANAPPGLEICNWGEDFSDFRETAAAISSLDLVISIDTSVAHLAGALGRQTFLLLPEVPDWRWLLNSTTSHWYTGMQLFRQRRQGDWRSVMLQVRDRLSSFCDNRTTYPMR